MSFMDRLRAFAHPTAEVQKLQASFDSERRIWTEKGHRLVSELENFPEWVIEPDGKVVTFVDKWVDKITGEVVSQAAHTLTTRHLESATTAGNVNDGPQEAASGVQQP